MSETRRHTKSQSKGESENNERSSRDGIPRMRINMIRKGKVGKGAGFGRVDRKWGGEIGLK